MLATTPSDAVSDAPLRARVAAGKAAARGEGGQLPAAKHLLNQWFTPLVEAIKCAHEWHECARLTAARLMRARGACTQG